MSQIRSATLLRALNISISIIAARVILFTIFIVYILVFDGKLKAEPVFVTMSIFNTLRHTMTWLFPNSISLAAEVYVSCGRVQVCNWFNLALLIAYCTNNIEILTEIFASRRSRN